MKSIHIELDEYVMAGIGIIAGLLLLVFPQQSLNVITYAIGAVALIYGILKIVSYFRNREYSPLFTWELILGIILVGIGIFSKEKFYRFSDYLCKSPQMLERLVISSISGILRFGRYPAYHGISEPHLALKSSKTVVETAVYYYAASLSIAAFAEV